jgi:hypothetical protein
MRCCVGSQFLRSSASDGCRNHFHNSRGIRSYPPPPGEGEVELRLLLTARPR